MDKFYTNSEVVDLVMDMFERLVVVSPGDVIVEPSAGDGAFLNRLAAYPNVIATDILPEKDGITQCDFLEFVPPETTGGHSRRRQPSFREERVSGDEILQEGCSVCDDDFFHPAKVVQEGNHDDEAAARL